MTFDQQVTLAVLAVVVAMLIWDRVRSDVVALAGAAVLLVSGAVRPSEVQGAFGSPAIITLASLFVLVYAIELSGLLDRLISGATRVCRRVGATGLWILIAMCGALSAFLNNTPIVVLAAPVIKETADTLSLSARRFLIPLSYICILGGTCTLIGTSTNLLVNDMARVAGQPQFGLFDITPVGLTIAAAGSIYLFFASGRLASSPATNEPIGVDQALETPSRFADGQPVEGKVFAVHRPLRPWRALISVAIFVGAIVAAAMGWTPIAAAAFAGAVLLILLRVITAEEAYSGLRPDVLLLIVGMVVIGIAMEESGLAATLTRALVGSVEPMGPLIALIALYGVTLFLTELLSNATIAVLVTPIAVALAESLAVSPRPFLVAVMMAGSAAFATPFGYQTNVLVYKMGGYSYMDFVRIGLPLNLITWVVGVAAIAVFFPF
ncbi:MAG: SLC13 family permease [Sphingomonas bacterium]|nr:SLC13 family permease [Sphingomonas bacterium]